MLMQGNRNYYSFILKSLSFDEPLFRGSINAGLFWAPVVRITVSNYSSEHNVVAESFQN